MNHRRREAALRSTLSTTTTECCTCQALSSLYTVPCAEQEEDGRAYVVPATPALNDMLRTALHSLFPRSSPLSLLLLHIWQLEYTLPGPHTVAHSRRYHASSELLEQILVNVRRAIRREDAVLTHEGTGAVILLPEVDHYGASTILERVYRNITLLQAETVIPPLKRETAILLGIGTYPEPGASLEQLLYHTGRVARHLTLRPAIATHHWSPLPNSSSEIPAPVLHEGHNAELHKHAATGVPFLQLPSEIPARLKQLIPYELALTLRCVPVGRNHHCLTVAMARPANQEEVRQLQLVTHMTIFPVSCEEEALNTLLAQKW